jgi:cytochrome oxidase Cu insertion factor (SCO1/SenC/PrrC family)
VRKSHVAILAGAAVGAGLVGVAAGALTRTRADPIRRPPLNGEATWPARARPAPAIAALRDQNGHRFSLAALRGHTVAMVFFDSYCRQACPLEGRALAAAERALPPAQRPVLVAVSVNPRDTPASTRAAVRAWGLAATGRWYWLRGTHAQLARVWRAYRIYVGAPVHGDIAHTEALYLIDRRGDERSAYLYPFLPHFVTHDLRALSGERPSA